MATHFHIGLPDDGAPKRAHTNRGRTHTDIFGIGEQAQATPKKDTPKTNIQNILMTEEDKTDGKKEENQDVKQKENKTENGNAAVPPTFQRVRMPPGGYSSGLW